MANSPENRVERGAAALPDLIFSQTDGGNDIVARMVELMRGQVDGARAADQLAAARELMDRAWGKPPSSPSAPGGDDADDDGRAEDAARRLREMIAAALAADAERSDA